MGDTGTTIAKGTLPAEPTQGLQETSWIEVKLYSPKNVCDKHLDEPAAFACMLQGSCRMNSKPLLLNDDED